MLLKLRSSFILLIFLNCIGEDLIDDYVDPDLRFTNVILSLPIGVTHQYIVRFFDESGTEVIDPSLMWEIEPPSIAEISESEEITALAEGEATVTVKTTGFQGETISAETVIYVSSSSITNSETIMENNEVIEVDSFFEGEIKTTSSYQLQGNFRYELNETRIILSLDETYRADSSLPGLYIYLGNNPNTVSDAYEIGAVQIFEGEHQYNLPESIKLMDHKYILYWCKPFNVKVGEGKIFD